MGEERLCRSFYQGGKMRKRALVLAVLAVMVVGGLLAGCGGSNTQQSTSSGQSGQGGTAGRVFTAQELAQFDGKNGQPAYVAVDGVVYDVSKSPLWANGMHDPCGTDAYAGIDLSEVLSAAPSRMRDYLKKFPVVGTYQ
jgi:predicted heme/steroid binding protein